MAEKKIQTRIALKIDTLAHWQDIWETFKPMAGEKILFQIPSGTAQTVEGNGITPPQVISKTGDGVTVLKDLPWDSALAADVAAWAKPGSGDDYVDMPSFVGYVNNMNTTLGSVNGRLTDLERKVPRDYATKGELSAMVGMPNYASNTDTIYGAKKYAEEKAAAVLGTDADAAGTATVHGALKAAAAADTKAANAATAASQANDNANSRVLTTTYEAGQKAQDDRLAALEGKIGGVTGAMHFKGVVTTDPTTITSGYNNGDVVIYGNKEYVFNNSAFVELGDTTAELQAITNLQTAVNTTIPGTYATKTELTNTINGLDGKSNGSGNFITGVSQTDCIVTVTKGSKAITDLSDANRVTTLETNLGTAQTNITNLQTAVKTIQDAPYATTGNIATAKSELIGTSADAATANTIYGAKKTAANVLGTSADAATANTVYGAKAAVTAEKTRAEQAEANLQTQINTINNNKTTVSTTANHGLKVTPNGNDYKVDIDTDVIFVFDCGSATVNAQNITK